MCVCFRMKIQDQAAMAVSPTLKSGVLPSQRKAQQALSHPRSGPRVTALISVQTEIPQQLFDSSP